jgi:dTDP-glucose 4,6-dehydratase
MKEKLLITGGLGFIPSNFIRNLLFQRKDYEVIGVDKVSSSSDLNSIYINKNQKFHIADITDTHIFDRIVEYEKPDIIIHAAALTSVDEALISPKAFIHNNVLGTQNVVEAVLKYKIKKLIYTSTDEVMGHQSSETEPSWTEESPTNPRNIYSSTKLAGENIIKSYGHSHGLNYCITRSSNNYGRRQTINKFIPRAIKSLIEGRKIPLYGEGREIRDWLHVNDNCNGILKIVENGKNGETYNISANQEYSNLEVVKLICDCMKRDLEIEFVPNRPGHDFRYSLNSRKLRELGWSPEIKFKDGLANTVEWYLLNKSQWLQ